MARAQSEQGMLAKAGFLHPQHALELLADPILENVDKNWLIEQLRYCADPNQALLEYVRLASAVESAGAEVSQIFAKVLADAVASRKLFAILGLSSALSNRLIAQPREVEIFLGVPEKTHLLELLTPYLAADTNFDYAAAVKVLRNHYWQRIMQIAAADLTQVDATAGMPEVGKEISALVEAALDGALAIAQRVVPESGEVGLAIIAMGKLGGEELNYISDVDVIYVARSLNSELAEAAMLEKATALAQIVARVVGAPGEVPALWKIDANLRPEGKEGPLVRTLESCLRYYNEWAESWEFQAHIKARPVAGDKELGAQYVQALAALVWRAAERSSFVADTQAMRRRVESLVPAKDAPRQIKLGAGGLRDVEFTVQLLQLVHGRADTTLRAAGTLEAIAALSDGGYISRRAAERLREDYKFLRTLEHRLQLQRFRRCQVLPEDSEELRRLARSISGSGFRSEQDLVSYWQRVRAEVRKLHLEIYYRPLLPETAKLSVDDVSLQPEAAQARLAAIGYRDPISALQHIEALTAGISRTAAIQKQLLPVMIGW
ncbi:bifunctional [glutamine synthetase] adenylyltransferase/[glutamine synthetase]-adenylyl-L-tyrosine phosphorylase, partial [uncultured Arcanobacterium sp.]|uniref:bifunctional [glutamine synthetase] adenylyltransferase/[glutamine synthetase]-adenylyl-L-tyrosine phosphorylase n=1 Tax=uncultured Arcanobacterium sp. TaxID=487520 RepID=UPI00262C46EF